MKILRNLNKTKKPRPYSPDCNMSRPILIDTHAHINFKPYEEDGHNVIKRTLKENVWFINIGSQYSTSKRSIKYAEKYKEGVYAAVGLHPIHVNKGGFVPMQDRDPDSEGVGETEWDGTVSEREFEELDLEKYKKLLEHPKVVALGEIGLDYFENITEEAKEKQKQVFMEQLDLARQIDKPIIFHCRKGYNDMLDLLEMFNFGCASCPMGGGCAPKLRGVLHCFMGRWSQAEKFLEMGLYLGFNGLITYARDYDKVIKNTPLDKILLETDAPYLTPEPHRGKRNEPLYVKYVAKKIAQIKGIKFEQVAKQTTKNAKELFGI